ncbi:MAG: hypothetical protein HYY68_03665, partial [Thaumarchaeota archaeon]|nr:hypothetical protein [Nitrososphaerota archaeon]
MAVPRQEKAYEKYAWIILFLEVGIFGLLFGSYLTLMGTLNLPYPDSQEPNYFTGMTWDELVARSPDTARYISQFHIRNSGIGSLFFTIVTMAMVGISYRKGERWAWYVSW